VKLDVVVKVGDVVLVGVLVEMGVDVLVGVSVKDNVDVSVGMLVSAGVRVGVTVFTTGATSITEARFEQAIGRTAMRIDRARKSEFFMETGLSL